MSADDFLIDAATRRQIMIQRASRGLFRELEGILEELRDELVAQINTAGTDFQRSRLGVLITSVDGILAGKTQQISQGMLESLQEFVGDELDFQKATLDQVLQVETTVPAPEAVLNAATTQPTKIVIGNTTQSLTVKQMVDVFARGQSKELKNTISAGFIAGDTPDQIARRVSQKIAGRTRAQARTVVQTATNHMAGVARAEFAKENEDRIGGEKFVATLDARTTPACSGLDGNIYEIGSGPMPPLHYNCRSLRVAVPREGTVLAGLQGERPAVNADGTVTQVSSNKTFSGWLRGQPADFQREFFRKYQNGEAKYELFQQGGLDAKDFIDNDGVEISLQELREQNPLAWQRATPTD